MRMKLYGHFVKRIDCVMRPYALSTALVFVVIQLHQTPSSPFVPQGMKGQSDKRLFESQTEHIIFCSAADQQWLRHQHHEQHCTWCRCSQVGKLWQKLLQTARWILDLPFEATFCHGCSAWQSAIVTVDCRASLLAGSQMHDSAWQVN